MSWSKRSSTSSLTSWIDCRDEKASCRSRCSRVHRGFSSAPLETRTRNRPIERASKRFPKHGSVWIAGSVQPQFWRLRSDPAVSGEWLLECHTPLVIVWRCANNVKENPSRRFSPTSPTRSQITDLRSNKWPIRHRDGPIRSAFGPGSDILTCSASTPSLSCRRCWLAGSGKPSCAAHRLPPC